MCGLKRRSKWFPKAQQLSKPRQHARMHDFQVDTSYGAGENKAEHKRTDQIKKTKCRAAKQHPGDGITEQEDGGSSGGSDHKELRLHLWNAVDGSPARVPSIFVFIVFPKTL